MTPIIGRPNLERKIKDMQPGESGYTTPWALSFDEEGKGWLNIKYTIHKDKGGTVELPVTRVGSGRSDYVVDVSRVNYKWSEGKASYVGCDDEDLVCLGGPQDQKKPLKPINVNDIKTSDN